MTNFDNTLSRLLLKLYERGPATTTHPRHFDELLYGTLNLSSGATSLTFAHGQATAVCELPTDLSTAPTQQRFTHPLEALWNAPLRGKTSLGESFDAPSAITTNYGTSWKAGHRVDRATILASRWKLQKAQPVLWAGALLTELPSDIGNLDLRVETQGQRSFSRGHSVLQGSRWRYALLAPNKSRYASPTIAIIPSADTPLDHGVFYRELHALSYCVGRPLDCNFLSGFSEDGAVVACAGGDYGFSRLRTNTVAAPVPEGDHESRFIPLFQAIARQLEVDDPRNPNLSEALWLYVEALSETSVSSYELKTLLACVTAARFFVPELPAILNRSEEASAALKRIVSDLQPYVPGDLADVLEARIKKLSVPDTLELVWLALREAQLVESQELLSVVQESTRILLGDIPSPNYNERCAKLRTLCSGLVSVAVGYDGPISGWHKADPYFFYLEDTTWRPAVGDPKPEYFTALVTSSLRAAPGDLWPAFIRPTIPPQSLLSLVDEFANSLASRASDEVRARLIPLSGTETEHQLFDFVLESRSNPAANTIIFSVRSRHGGDSIEIVNWEESVEPMGTEDSLLRFLETVANSASTRLAVERLLSLSTRLDD